MRCTPAHNAKVLLSERRVPLSGHFFTVIVQPLPCSASGYFSAPSLARMLLIHSSLVLPSGIRRAPGLAQDTGSGAFCSLGHARASISSVIVRIFALLEPMSVVAARGRKVAPLRCPLKRRSGPGLVPDCRIRGFLHPNGYLRHRHWLRLPIEFCHSIPKQLGSASTHWNSR